MFVADVNRSISVGTIMIHTTKVTRLYHKLYPAENTHASVLPAALPSGNQKYTPDKS